METSTNHYEDEPIEGIDPTLNVYMHLENNNRTMIDFGILYEGSIIPVKNKGQLAVIDQNCNSSVLFLNRQEMILLRDTLTNVLNYKG